MTTKKASQSMKTAQQAMLLVAICAAIACGGKIGAADNNLGATGSGVLGGNGRVGGTVSVGGAVNTGGVAAAYGGNVSVTLGGSPMLAIGGAPITGGSKSTGGMVATSAISATGGLNATGGAVTTGGISTTGGVAAIGNASAGGSTGVVAACVDVVATGSPGLIDDLSAGNGETLPNDGRDGFWYVANDGTGQQTPSPPSGSGCDPTYVFSPKGQACTSGSGFQGWGAAIGLTLVDSRHCTSCNYDVTAYHGVSFTISAAFPISIRFQIITADTHAVQWGGTCTSSSCIGGYGIDIQVTPASQVVNLLWSELAQGSWSTQIPMNLHQFQNLEWDIAGDATVPTSFQDLCIDNVAFF